MHPLKASSGERMDYDSRYTLIELAPHLKRPPPGVLEVWGQHPRVRASLTVCPRVPALPRISPCPVL